MKKITTFILLSLLAAKSFAQSTNSDSTHWTQLINQPQINYLKVKNAFEKERKQTLELLKANNPLISDDSLAKIERENEGIYNLFKRWEYLILPRLDKNGDFDAIKQAENWKTYIDNVNLKKKTQQINAANWQSIGPFKATATTEANSGRVECIAFHPTDVNTFYIGAPNGGVWKTTNGGTNWQYLSQNWPDQGVTALAVNPTNPSIVFALNYRNYFYKSTDAGTTWDYIYIGYYALNKLLINPNNSQIMLANSNGGIIRSDDGGNTWTKNFISDGYSIEDIKFKPNDPSVVYATSSQVVYKSIDGGITFNAIYTLPTTSEAANIAVAAAAPNNLYVAYNPKGSNFGAIYKSTNAGSTFTTITDGNTPTDNKTMQELAFHYGRVALTLAISPTNANQIWIGLAPLFKTTNGGASWSSAGSNGVSVHFDHHCAEYQPISGKLFIGCDGGLYRYTTSTNVYEILDGMNITQIYRIGGLQNDKSKLLYGAQDNGTNKWETNLFKFIYGGDGMECIIDYTNTNTLYASYQNGELRKSTDNGINWIDISPIKLPPNTIWVTPWEMHPTNSQVLYACNKEVYKTTNGGTTWNVITNFNLNQTVNFLKIAPSNPNILYACSGFSFIKSFDGGISWNTLNLPLGGYSAYDLTIDASNPNNIWMIGQGAVFSSTDGGLSWLNISSGTSLPDIGLKCILLDKGSNDIYLGTTGGVFVLPANGTDWIFFNDGLPNVEIQELEISYVDGNILRAATFGRGLWETTVYTPCPRSIQITLHSGNWSDKSTWQCGTIPNLSKDVQINHAITIDGIAAQANRLIYNGGTLKFINNGSIRLNQ